MADKRKWIILTGSIAAVLMGAALMVPWTMLVENRLTSMLAAKGLTDIKLQVKSVGVSSIALENVSIGGEAPLTLKQVTVDYTLSDLWQGRLRTLTLSDLALDFRKTPKGWGIAGLENLQGAQGGKEGFIPVTASAIPLEKASIENSHLTLHSESITGDIPLQVNWQKSPAPGVVYKAPSITFTMGGITMVTGEVTAQAQLHEQEKLWKGSWGTKHIVFTGLPVGMPESEASGMMTAGPDRLTLQGKWQNAWRLHKAAFSLDYRFDDPDRSVFTLDSFSMPWKGGMLFLQKTVVPLSGKKPYTIVASMKNISLNELLAPLIDKRVTATGIVSGQLPITVKPDGNFVIGEGTLSSYEPGTIVMAPDAIPGDNAQIAMLRDLLKDFRYTQLSLSVDNDKNNKPSVALSLQGNNPAMYNGRPVKLNVHLGGDVLDFIRQSMAINDPKGYLKGSQ